MPTDKRTIDDLLAEDEIPKKRPGPISRINNDILDLSESLLEGSPQQRTLANQPRNFGIQLTEEK